ncbi:MAG: hypothetical protein F6J93_24870 [Oscillatoria sp. SIO1A7]|nr:hypothetical protein [Oscillatoria sp. SIO1A7]
MQGSYLQAPFIYCLRFILEAGLPIGKKLAKKLEVVRRMRSLNFGDIATWAIARVWGVGCRV